MIKIELKNNFNLDSTVTCGQIFRYYKLEDNSYDIILKDRVINVYKKDNYIIASSNNEDDLEIVVRNYFDLDNDYENINKYLLEKDSLLKDAIMFSCGLMMIKQDPFETLIEYIISANNGVPNITSSLNNIAKKYGKKVLFNKKEYYLFPSYKDLKDVTKKGFRECKVGFRDKYLESIIYKLNNNININSSLKALIMKYKILLFFSFITIFLPYSFILLFTSLLDKPLLLVLYLVYTSSIFNLDISLYLSKIVLLSILFIVPLPYYLR